MSPSFSRHWFHSYKTSE